MTWPYIYTPPFPAPRPSLRHSFILGSTVGEYYSFYGRTAALLPLCEWMPSLPEEMHWIIRSVLKVPLFHRSLVVCLLDQREVHGGGGVPRGPSWRPAPGHHLV